MKKWLSMCCAHVWPICDVIVEIEILCDMFDRVGSYVILIALNTCKQLYGII